MIMTAMVSPERTAEPSMDALTTPGPSVWKHQRCE
jgi:hypothetical protein